MVKEIVLKPDYENVAAWQANGLMTHSFDFGAREPMVSFIEHVRYLAVMDEREGKTGAQASRVMKLIRRVERSGSIG